MNDWSMERPPDMEGMGLGRAGGGGGIMPGGNVGSFASSSSSSFGDGVLGQSQHAYSDSNNGSGIHGQVMTDKQMETLRRQISVYATICQQLVEMHKAIIAQQNALPGFRLGHPIPYDSMMAIAGHKMTSRQRWTPTQMQLQILESIFDQGNGTPTKQKIKEITAELAQHGQISETNVYNWFQNRRARTKRKQQLGAPNNGDSEFETELDNPIEKKAKMNNNSLQESQIARQNDLSFPCSEGTSNQYQFESQRHASEGALRSYLDSKSVMNFSRIPSFERGLTAARNGQLIGLDEQVDDFNSMHTEEGYQMMSMASDLGVSTTMLSNSIERHAK